MGVNFCRLVLRFYTIHCTHSGLILTEHYSVSLLFMLAINIFPTQVLFG